MYVFSKLVQKLFVNKYQPSEPCGLGDLSFILDPAYQWDFNYFYPVKALANDRLRLVPFVPAWFAEAYLDLVRPNPEIFHLIYSPFSTWTHLDQFLEFLEVYTRQNPGRLFFAVLDLTDDFEDARWGRGRLAGMIALINTEPQNLSVEIGFVLIGKPFQRTHVTTNACGLLLQWCFEDLEMRRVQWQANHLNKPSVEAAKKMGFIFEGTIRWQVVLPKDRDSYGEPVMRDGRQEALGRHTVVLSISWQEWESGVKELMAKRMARLS